MHSNISKFASGFLWFGFHVPHLRYT